MEMLVLRTVSSTLVRRVSGDLSWTRTYGEAFKSSRYAIANITQDGCTTSLWCKHDGNQANMEYVTKCENKMEKIKQTIAKIEKRTDYLLGGDGKMDMVENKIDRIGEHVAGTEDKLKTIEDTIDELIKMLGK